MNMEALIARRLEHSHALLEQCSNEQSRLTEEIKGLQKAYNRQENIRSKTEIEIALLVELNTTGNSSKKPKPHPLSRLAHTLTPYQSTVMNLLPDQKHSAISTSEIFEFVRALDNPIERKTSLHRILHALEGKRLVGFIKAGRAHHWYKL